MATASMTCGRFEASGRSKSELLDGLGRRIAAPLGAMRPTPATSIRQKRSATGKTSAPPGRVARAGLSAGRLNVMGRADVSARKVTRSGSLPRETTLFQPVGAFCAGSVTIRAGGSGGFGNSVRSRSEAAPPAGFSHRVSVAIRSGLRHVDRNFVAADAGAPVLQALPQVIGNGRLHGQLERRAAPHPGQMLRVDRPVAEHPATRCR